MRITLDTNVMISGLLSKASPPGRLMLAWPDGRFTLVTSTYQLDELRRAVGYERLRDRITPEQIREFLENVDAKATVLDDLPNVDVSPDRKDNSILATAIAGKADLIVSGDKADMLSLGEVETIPIVTAREAVDRIDKKA